MVFAVNPTAAKSFDAFQAAAKASSSDGSPSSSGSGTSASSSTAAGSTPSASATGGAMRHSGSAAVVLAVVGIAAGIML
jgi:hypothetical protein